MPGNKAAKKKKMGTPPPPSSRPNRRSRRCSVCFAAGRPRGSFKETRTSRPWDVCGVPINGDRAAQGARLLDSHIAPSEKRAGWAALTHSRVKLERLVLDEPPEHVGTTSKLWNELHPAFKEGWTKTRDDRVSTAGALFFCAAAVKKDQHDDDGVSTATAGLLAAARPKGLSDKDLEYGYEAVTDITEPGSLFNSVLVRCQPRLCCRACLPAAPH